MVMVHHTQTAKYGGLLDHGTGQALAALSRDYSMTFKAFLMEGEAGEEVGLDSQGAGGGEERVEDDGSEEEPCIFGGGECYWQI